MVGDYLIESECESKHVSSITIRGHDRDVAYALARRLDDRCHWPHGDDICGARVAHVVTDLGPPESARRGPQTPPIRKTTKPSMQAVIVPASLLLSKRPPVEIVENDGFEIRGDESTEPPPPTTEGGDDDG